MQGSSGAVYTMCSVQLPEEDRSVNVINYKGDPMFTATRNGYDWSFARMTADGWQDFTLHISENDWWSYINHKKVEEHQQHSIQLSPST